MKKITVFLVVFLGLSLISNSQDLIFKFHGEDKNQNLNLYLELKAPKSQEEKENIIAFFNQNEEQIVAMLDTVKLWQECARMAKARASQQQVVANTIFPNQSYTQIDPVPEPESPSTNNPQTVQRNEEFEKARQQQLNEYHERVERQRNEERALQERQNKAHLERVQRDQKLQDDLKRAEQWFTSDANWNQSVILSVQTYGYEATKQMIEERQANSASGMGRAQTGETVVNGVLANGQHVKLKIANGRVVAYSISDNSSQNRMNWTSTFRNAGEGVIVQVGAKDSFEVQRRFQNKVYIGSLGTVYF